MKNLTLDKSNKKSKLSNPSSTGGFGPHFENSVQTSFVVLMQAKAAVRQCTEQILDSFLPQAYAKDIFKIKCGLLYQHVYESYYGSGKSVYMKK